MARVPICCILLVVVLAGGLIAVLYPGFEVVTDFGEFMQADGEAAMYQAAFDAAQDARRSGKSSKGKSRRLSALDLFQSVYFSINYRARSGQILSEPALADARSLELKLRNLPSWKKLCQTDEYVPRIRRSMCDPGISFINFMWPSINASGPLGAELGSLTSEWHTLFDGRGMEMLPVEVALLAADKGGFRDLMFPKNIEPEEATLMQSSFHFRIFCCTARDPAGERKKKLAKLLKIVESMIQDEIYPVVSTASTENVEVFYDGFGLKTYEILQAVQSDTLFAMGSGTFVFAYMILHTRSILCSFLGLVFVFLSIPLGFVILVQLKEGANDLSIASFLSLFLVIGIGSDTIFVFSDFWKQSSQAQLAVSELGDNSEQHHVYFARLLWTYKHAGKSTLATTMTTAASFFANLASVLRALREFGVFMGLCIVFSWTLSFCAYPAALVLDEQLHRCFWAVVARCQGPRRRELGGSWAGTITVARRSSFSDSDPYEYYTLCDFLEQLVKFCDRKAFFKTKLPKFIYHWKKTLLFFFVALSVSALASALALIEVDTSNPQIFPEGHNQADGPKVQMRFNKPEKEDQPKVSSLVCGPLAGSPKLLKDKRTGVQTLLKSKCVIHWCQVKTGSTDTVASSDQHSCQCSEPLTHCRSNASQVESIVRFIGLGDLKAPDITRLVKQNLTGMGFADAEWIRPPYVNIVLSSNHKIGSLVQQNWETGAYHMTTMHETIASVTTANSIPQLCGTRRLCYCSNVKECQWTQRQDSIALQLPNLRRLATSKANSISIKVAFGLLLKDKPKLLGKVESDNLWQYDKNHMPGKAWSQRYMYRFCKEVPDHLRVVEKQCWIMTFRNWLQEKGLEFPSRKFDVHAKKFLAANILTGTFLTADFLWFDKSPFILHASYMNFLARKPGKSAADTLQYKKQWDEYIAKWLGEGAGPYVSTVWHTSKDWVRADANVAIQDSTLSTMFVSIGCGFGGMLIFTRDPLLAIYAIGSVIGVICCLAGFMISVMQWSLGPIEVIALIVFVGYSVTYSLHIAHKYNDAVIAVLAAEDSSESGSPSESESPSPSALVHSTENSPSSPSRSLQRTSLSPAVARRSILPTGRRQTTCIGDDVTALSWAVGSSAAVNQRKSFVRGEEHRLSISPYAAGKSLTFGSDSSLPRRISISPHASRKSLTLEQRGELKALEGSSSIPSSTRISISVQRRSTTGTSTRPSDRPSTSVASSSAFSAFPTLPSSAQEDASQNEAGSDEGLQDLEDELNLYGVQFVRAQFALYRMGASAVGSAVTTLGSAVFLLACEISIFVKLGLVVFMVTLFAISFALIPLPALLMLIGPKETFRERLRPLFECICYGRPLRSKNGSSKHRPKDRGHGHERLSDTPEAKSRFGFFTRFRLFKRRGHQAEVQHPATTSDSPGSSNVEVRPQNDPVSYLPRPTGDVGSFSNMDAPRSPAPHAKSEEDRVSTSSDIRIGMQEDYPSAPIEQAVQEDIAPALPCPALHLTKEDTAEDTTEQIIQEDISLVLSSPSPALHLALEATAGEAFAIVDHVHHNEPIQNLPRTSPMLKAK